MRDLSLSSNRMEFYTYEILLSQSKTKYNSQLSELFLRERALSGVSQELVLGLFLFLIHINDLPDGIQSIFTIFVDQMSRF